MKTLLLTCVLFVLLTTGADAKQSHNLIRNGSFERGVAKWRVFGDTRVIDGVCDKKAVALHGTLQSKIVRVKVGRAYRVSFQYRGERLRATVLMDLPPTSSWAQMSYTFVPTHKRAVVAFEGTGHIDCVSMSAK